MSGERTVLLAGVGGDAHFVGLTILRAALLRSGFRVVFLGAQNDVDRVCRRARDVDAVLISNMDGHARYYLEDLRGAQREHRVADRLWFLGGYPSLDDRPETLDELRELGFDRVCHGYVDAGAVIDMLFESLPAPGGRARRGSVRQARLNVPSAPLPVQDEPWPPQQREKVLSSWPTGWSARDLAVNADRLAKCARLADRQAWADREILVQPRTGVSDNDSQRELFAQLRAAGADVLSFQIDSLTRNNRYEEIERLLKGAPVEPGSPPVLNGYPAVNLGVERMAAIAGEFPTVPMQVRHSTRDPRLLAELTFAAGISAFEGGALSYNLPYFSDYPVREALERWQYVDRLAGHYHAEHGITIDREFFGVLTACLVPPCIAVAVNVFEALLAAEAGVKSVTLGYAEQGNRAQDLAAVRVMRAVTQSYLAVRGLTDVSVEVVWHQYMGPFPRSATKAWELLVGSAVTAARSEAVRLMLKTDVEAVRIPDVRDNGAALVLVKRACAAERQRPRPVPSVADGAEEQLVETEARAIIDRSLEAADGVVSVAVQLAVARGWLDVPFSPSRWNAGKVLPLRDCSGAVRLAGVGDLPFPPEVVERHRAAVAERCARDGGHLDELVARDVTLTARGAFDAWPLG
ncbi:MAG: cobalamin-dependent protein [Streptosporangiaceae bacterium]|nr:cobalamin-dependent protein [Streptosporangiaceae bacterium]